MLLLMRSSQDGIGIHAHSQNLFLIYIQEGVRITPSPRLVVVREKIERRDESSSEPKIRILWSTIFHYDVKSKFEHPRNRMWTLLRFSMHTSLFLLYYVLECSFYGVLESGLIEPRFTVLPCITGTQVKLDSVADFSLHQ
jgi:hypothetical protein